MANKDKAALAPSRRPKTIYSLDSPFTKVKWHAQSKTIPDKTLTSVRPEIPPDEHARILDLLCGLLAPIGQHRSQHIVPSKGKRRRRRAMDQGTTGQESNRSGDESSKPVPPSLAELQTHLTVGFNTTTRYLEALARCSAPNKAADQNPGSASLDLKPLAAVFVPRSDQAPILYSHLPLFVKTASLASPSLPATRLVMLPKGAEKRLAAALSISRVGLIGVLDDTPEAALMIELLRLRVPEVKVPWLVEATTGAYLPVNIKAIQTTTPSETKSSGQRPASLVGDED